MEEEQELEVPGQVTARIISMLVTIVHKAAFIDNQPVDLGDGLLSAAEIHLIDMAGIFPSAHISELAVRLGVTKGAVSQMVQKLEKKGYLTRTKEGDNRKNICLQLTRSGRTAFYWHQELHRSVDVQILSLLNNLEEGEQLRILEIFSCMSETLDRSLEVREAQIRKFLDSYQ